jgi:hypothetical protein
MARVFIDGFETKKYLASAGGLWDTYDGGAWGPYTGFDGVGWCMGSPGNSGNIWKYLPSVASEYFGFHYKGTGIAGKFFRMYNGSTVLGSLYYSPITGLFTAYKGDQATWLANGSITIPNGDWAHIQIYYLPHDTTGSFKVKINGVLDIDFSGSTSPSTANIDRVGIYCPGGSASYYFDNFVVDDAAWTGVSRIALCAPTGAGNSAQWTPSAGNNWDCVEEIPYSDTEYVSTNTVDQVDTYALSDLPSAAAVVKCVQVVARARKEGSATPQNIALAVRTTGGDAYSADQALQTSFQSHMKIWETNPGTAAAWTVSEVNAMEAGVKSRT